VTDVKLPELPELPQVLKRVTHPTIIEDGKEVGPLPTGEMQEIIQLAQLGQMVRIRKALEREQTQGFYDRRDLGCMDEIQFIDLISGQPGFPWATAYFYNYGDGNAYIGINQVEPNPHVLEKGEGYKADSTKSNERISKIFYWCDPGNTALVRVVGNY